MSSESPHRKHSLWLAGTTYRRNKGILKYTDIFFPNLDEVRAIVGKKNLTEVLNILVEGGLSKVAIKMGQKEEENAKIQRSNS